MVVGDCRRKHFIAITAPVFRPGAVSLRACERRKACLLAMTSDPGPSSLAAAPSYAGSWTRLQPRLHPALETHVSSTLGFAQMTPVQSSVIPLFLSHKDVIVEAVTGSGKTLAYVLPVLQMISRRNAARSTALKRNQVGALIVCPTRELAIQVHGVVADVLGRQSRGEDDAQDGKDDGVTAGDEASSAARPAPSDEHVSVSGALLAVGGSTSSPADDYRHFKAMGADIVVGTPGRAEELMKRTGVDLKELEVLILDEADRLLDMGFQQSITAIIHMLPKQRRTGLFSATMTDALGELVRVGLRNPVRVVVKVESKRAGTSASRSNATANDKRMPATLESYVLVSRPEHKVLQLLRLLWREVQRPVDELPTRKAIVYFATCAQVNYFYKVLSPLEQAAGLKMYSLHGKQTPVRRRATYDAFVSATPMGSASTTSSEMASILLCTDVAARGLDLSSVDLVVQFDPPTDPKVFSHRCGRTARAGRRGRAVVMLQSGREEDYVDFLRVRKIPVRPYTYLADAGGAGSAARVAAGDEPTPCDAGDANIDSGALGIHQGMRDIVRADRALHELGMQAFVSFVQGYRKHEVSFVFRERDLDLGALAFCFGLLRLPRMPEVTRWRKAIEADQRQRSSASVFQEEDVDLDNFAFADRKREVQRLAAKEVDAKKRAAAATSKAGAEDEERKRGLPRTNGAAARAAPAWSEQTARKERRQERRDKKVRKRAFLARQREDTVAGVNGRAIDKASRGEDDGDGGDNDDDDDDDQDDWAAEERQAKKAKRAKAQSNGRSLTNGRDRGDDDDDDKNGPEQPAPLFKDL